MKIAIVNRHLKDVFGGSEMQCDNIARGLTVRGHEVLYVAPSGHEGDYGVSYKVVSAENNGNDIAAKVLAFNPDIVYWRFNKYYFYRAARKIAARNIPLVFAISHIDDTLLFSYRDNPRKGLVPFLRCVKQGLTTAANHCGYKYVSGVTSLNPEFLNRVPVKSQIFVPNSVNLATVPFTWPRPFVVWVANIKPQKQPQIYVDLAKQFPDTDFLMVGTIQSVDYKWISTENSRTPNFHYLGPKTPEEVNGILEQSIMLVHTCKPEGFGNNFLQAWFQKKPTVSFAFDPAGYIAEEQLGGFAGSNWDIFVAHVARYIQDEDQRKQTGLRAYNFAMRNFSLDKTVETLETYLQEILAAKRAA